MSAVTFSIPSSGILVSGQWTQFSTYIDGKNGCRIDLLATGTKVELLIQSVSGTTLSVIVDGGSPSTNTPGAVGSDTYITIADSLSDAQHSISIVVTSDSSLDIQWTGAVRVTGASPSLATPAFIGPQIRTGTPTGNAFIASPVSLAFLRAEGGYGLDTFYLGNAYQASLRVNSLLSVKATCSSLYLWAVNNGQTYRLYIDGVARFQYTTATGDGLAVFLRVGTGLDTSNEHTYGVMCVDHQSSWIFEVAVDSAGTVSIAYSFPPRDGIVTVGDSITECVTGTNNDASQGWPALLATSLGLALNNLGRSGAYLSASLGGADSIETVSAGYPTFDNLTTLYLMGGANDASANLDPATFQASYTATLNHLLAKTTAPISCLGITDNSSAQASVDALNAVIPAAIAACDDPSRVTFTPTAGWVSPDNFVSGAHPNDAGNVQIFQHLSPAPSGNALLGAGFFM